MMDLTYTKVFLTVKLVLGFVILVVPKQYDVSSDILFPACQFGASLIPRFLAHLIRRLCIWDTVYYLSAASRGKLLYEHEWAFGQFWSVLIRFCTPRWLMIFDSLDPIYYYGLTGITIANTCHYLAGLQLYHATRRIFPGDVQLARNAAIIYAMTPAGIFMMSAYAEPLFALSSFVAINLRENGYWWLETIVFASTVGFRSNGLLWGILYLYDLYRSMIRMRIWMSLRAIIQGSLLGATFVGLQYRGYQEFCVFGDTRSEWCNSRLPSIYAYVQAKYWNNGFLAYWTPNNIPNFMFALPTLIIMYRAVRKGNWPPKVRPYIIIHSTMGIAALFFWHVQIITRISTCLPTIYWYISQTYRINRYETSIIVTYIAVWILLQGVLFGAYLPPA